MASKRNTKSKTQIRKEEAVAKDAEAKAEATEATTEPTEAEVKADDKKADKKTAKKAVNLDKIVEERKTTGTEFQAYMRDCIKAGKVL